MPTKISMLMNPLSRRSWNTSGPQEDEDHLDVEGDEHQGVDVERDAEAGVGVAVGVDARLVRVALVRVAAGAVGDEPGQPDRGEHEQRAGEGEPDDVPDPGHVVLEGERGRNGRGRPAFEMMAFSHAAPPNLPARRSHSSSGVPAGGCRDRARWRVIRPCSRVPIGPPPHAGAARVRPGMAVPGGSPRPNTSTRKPPIPRGSMSRASADRSRSASCSPAPGPRARRRRGPRSPRRRAAPPGSSRRWTSRPAAAAAARTAARSTVAVRSWRPTWRNGSPPTACRAKARSVPVGLRRPVERRGLGGVVHEHHHAAGEVARGLRQPPVEREAHLRHLPVGERDALRRQARREGRRSWGPTSTARNLPSSPTPTSSSRIPPDRPITRWTGSASRTSFATTAPVSAGATGAPGRSRGTRPGRPRPGAPAASSIRAGSTSTGRYRIASSSGEPQVPQAAEQARRQRTGAGPGLGDGERCRTAQRVPGLLQQPADRRAEDRVGLRRGEEVAGATRAGVRPPVVAVAGLVQGTLHEPREGDRPVGLDLDSEPGDELLVLADGLRVRQSLAVEAGLHHGPAPACARARRIAARSAGVTGRPPAPARAPGPTSPCPPSRIGHGRLGGGRGELGEPRVADAVRQEQVAREAVLGRGPATLVRAEAVGQQDPPVQQRPVGQRSHVTPERARPVAVQELAEDAARRAPVGTADQGAGRGGPEAPLLDERPRPAPGLPLQPAKVRRGHPASDQQLRARVGGQRPEGGQPRRGPACRRPPPGSGSPAPRRRPFEQQQVQRRVHVHRQATPRAKVPHLHAGHLGQPAGQGVVGGEVRGQRGKHEVGAGDRDRIGGVAVVGQGAGRLRGGGDEERAKVRAGREGDRASPQHHQPGRPQLRHEAAEARAEWSIVGRLPAHDGLGRAGREEAPPVALGQRGARRVQDALERAGVGREGGGEDQDGDGGHRPGV